MKPQSLLNKGEAKALQEALSDHNTTNFCDCSCGAPVLDMDVHWSELAFKAGERYAARAIRDGRTE